MATPIADTMVDHSSLDNTGAPILGSEVDENPETLAAVLDGSSDLSLNAATAAYLNFTVTPYSLDHQAGRVKVYNNSGGSIAAGAYVYVSGYDATEELYTVAKAVATQANSTTLYAQLVMNSLTATSTVGYASRMRVLTGQDTSGLTAGRPIFLSSTAGGWSGTVLDPEYRVQIVGFVASVDGSAGRIIQLPGPIIPWDLANTI